MRVEVTRAFYWEGQVRQTGTVLDVSDRQAGELAAMGKAKPVQSSAPAARGHMTTERTDGLGAGGRKTRKEPHDAGKARPGG